MDLCLGLALGPDKLTIEGNWKFRELRERFLHNEGKKIDIVSHKPLTVIWK